MYLSLRVLLSLSTHKVKRGFFFQPFFSQLLFNFGLFLEINSCFSLLRKQIFSKVNTRLK